MRPQNHFSLTLLMIQILFCVVAATDVESYNYNNGNNDDVISSGIKETLTWESCDSFTTCNECSSSSLGLCHWCAFDDACHTIGSIYGCFWGVDCNSIEQCERDEPEWRGFSKSTIYAMSIAGIVSFLMATFFLSRSNKRESRIHPPTSSFNRIETASSEENITSEYHKLNEEGGLQRNTSYGSVHHQHNCDFNENQNCDFDERNQLLTIEQSSTTTEDFCALCIQSTKCILLALLIATATVFIIAFFPKSPEINFCSSEVAWDDIMNSIIDLDLKATFQVLISVYNPNPYNIQLNLVHGRFLHDDMIFGAYNVDPISIKALSITDDLVTVNFAPQDCQAVNIIQEYWSGTLNFTVDTLFNVSLPDFYNYTFAAELNSSILDLGDANNHNKDQRLCACFYDES